ncbi:MAG: dnaX [Friedmanniella sp.]|nr:dnaX [Friedmanniella sp.]
MLEAPLDSTQDEALFEEPQSAARMATAPLALYRRYRPDTFADVIGQEHVTDPLQRALTNNRVNHAYLFSGPRGCGKTTSARILARALNCEFGPRPEPCGQCQSCRDLARGGAGSIDVIEIDAASHGGVYDSRDLRERSIFAPVSSRFMVYIIDEAHMVTTQGFNALLKLVEEPPPHVKFIFATTEPEKVIGTIRSRTHHYPFRLVPPRVLTEYLGKLCTAEGIVVEAAVLPLVVRAGAGSVRDSLSVLDQLLGGAEEAGVSYRQATALLGYTPDSLLDEFVDAFTVGDAGGVFSCVDKVIEVGQDPRRFAEDLLRRLRDLVIVAAVPDALTSGLIDVAADQAERLSSQAASLGSGELTRAAEVVAAGLTDMRGTTAPRLHLELMCARVLLPGADVDERGVHARLDRLERRMGMDEGPAEARTPVVGSAPAPAPVAQPGPAAVRPSPAAVRPSPSPQTAPAPGSPEPTGEVPEAPTPAPAASPGPAAAEITTAAPSVPTTSGPTSAPAAPPTRPVAAPHPARSGEEATGPDHRGPAGGETDNTAAVSGPDRDDKAAASASAPGGDGGPQLNVVDIRRLWPEVLEEVKGKRRFTWILLSQNAQVAEVRNKTLMLAMPNAGARDSFSRGGSEDVLREALVVVLGVDLKIETMVDSSVGPPAEPARPVSASEQATASWNAPPVESGAPPAGAGEPTPDPVGMAPPSPPEPPTSQVDPQLREQLRQGIRPTRHQPADRGADDDRDAAAHRTDSDLEETTVSHTELLARHLGAEIIAEEDHGA